jgi:hypothetical protein
MGGLGIPGAESPESHQSLAGITWSIDPDPVMAELDVQRLCNVHQTGVAGAAAEVAGVVRGATTDVDDAAPARFLHQRDDGVRAA